MGGEVHGHMYGVFDRRGTVGLRCDLREDWGGEVRDFGGERGGRRDLGRNVV